MARAVLLAVLCLACACAFPTVKLSTESHYDFGYQLGIQTANMIADRFDKDTALASTLEWAESNAAVVNRYVTTHARLFPEYMDELQGMADGSGQTFMRMFVANLAEEFSYFVGVTKAGRRRTDHCSDYLVNTGTTVMGGHNEDSGVETLNNTLLIEATVGTEPSFFCYAYAGELPTVAFGVNAAGIGFTLNFVQPTVDWVKYGIGRNFLSRALLAAPDWPAAVAIATVHGQASGRSVNLFDFTTQRLANIESAGDKSVLTVPTDTSPLFHANLYVHLDVAQFPDEDSVHRDKRAAQLPLPTNRSGIVNVLGDTDDTFGPPYYTIYQQGGDGLYTMATAFYDLLSCTVDVVTGNPLTSPKPIARWKVPGC